MIFGLCAAMGFTGYATFLWLTKTVYNYKATPETTLWFRVVLFVGMINFFVMALAVIAVFIKGIISTVF